MQTCPPLSLPVFANCLWFSARSCPLLFSCSISFKKSTLCCPLAQLPPSTSVSFCNEERKKETSVFTGRKEKRELKSLQRPSSFAFDRKKEKRKIRLGLSCQTALLVCDSFHLCLVPSFFTPSRLSGSSRLDGCFFSPNHSASRGDKS